MERRVTQETFDQAVLENMSDFDLSKEDAIKDTIQQFVSQGVNLSAIDVSGGVGREEFNTAFNGLKDGTGSALEHLTAIKSLCSDSYEFSSRNKNWLTVSAGVSVIASYLSTEQSPDVLKECMDVLVVVCKNMVKNTDYFEPGGSQKLKDVISHYVSTWSDNTEMILASAFRLAKIVVRSEDIKVAFMRNNIGHVICDILKKTMEGINRDGYTDLDSKLVFVQDMCLTIRGLSIHDDLRRDMSSAYDNGKFFLSADGLVQNLLILSKGFLLAPRVAAAALAALKQLVLSEEAVQVVSMHGAMQLPGGVLGWSDAPLILVRSVTGLMRNLCADDKRKNKLVQDGVLHLMVRAMSDERYNVDPQFMDNAAACLAAISLRSASNSRSIVECGAIQELISGMRRHHDKVSFQRQACLAVRNIAARGGDSMKNILLETGIEGVLRAAGTLQGAVDEAYAALRDLNCEVQFVSVTAEGYALPVYEQFGTGKKLQFNPVWDETDDIDRRVESEARAPFAESAPETIFKSSGDSGHDHGHEHGHDHDHKGGCC